MKIALIELNISSDCAVNLSRCRTALGAAARHGADLALLPEMTLSGYNTKPWLVDPLGFEALPHFSDIARELFMAVGVGYIEKKGERYLNKFAVFSKDGTLIADYAKIHPFSFAGESICFDGGIEAVTFQLGGVEIGPTICYDLRFAELYHALSDRCQLMTVAANWPLVRGEHWDLLLRARAVENQCYVAGVNVRGHLDGYEYGGGSVLVDPYGHVVSAPVESFAEGENKHWEVFIGEVDIPAMEKYRLSFPVLKDRRDELWYGQGAK